MSELKTAGQIAEGLFFGGSGKGFKAPDGVKGPNNSAEFALIKIDSKLAADESITLYFLNKGEYNAVVLTNLRFLKIENGKTVSNVVLKQIKKVEHEKNGIFRWDKVVTTTESGVETFGIYQSAVAEFFVDTLRRVVS